MVDGYLLVCKNKNDPHVYLPDGHVEWEEQTRESLRREILEEMGKDSQVHRFLGAVEHSFLQHGERRREINLIFEISVDGLDVHTDPDSCESHIEFRWVSMKRLTSCDIQPAVLKETIGTWLADRNGTERWVTS